MRKFTATLMFLMVLFAAAVAHAEVDIPWAWIQQQAIDTTVTQVKTVVSPFSAEAGFPEKRPAGLEGKDWETLYQSVIAASAQCERLMADLVSKNKFPIRLKLGAQYFQKRFAIGAFSFPNLKGNQKAFEFLCKDFARECDEGLLELRAWASAEGVFTMEYLWTKNATEGLDRVKALLPEFPDTIPYGQAQKIWRTLATKAIAASNEAGMAASRIGAFDFPAWRLRYAVKYFKATLKEAVVPYWDSSRLPEAEWVKAIEELRQRVMALPAEMDELTSQLQK